VNSLPEPRDHRSSLRKQKKRTMHVSVVVVGKSLSANDMFLSVLAVVPSPATRMALRALRVARSELQYTSKIVQIMGHRALDMEKERTAS
jgi:hypothetical protein